MKLLCQHTEQQISTGSKTHTSVYVSGHTCKFSIPLAINFLIAMFQIEVT